jgi:hypothetical protein
MKSGSSFLSHSSSLNPSSLCDAHSTCVAGSDSGYRWIGEVLVPLGEVVHGEHGAGGDPEVRDPLPSQPPLRRRQRMDGISSAQVFTGS